MDDVYLLGNGPSLKNIDISKLKDKITISFNRAFIAYEKHWEFYPTYYMAIDIHATNGCREEICDLIVNSPIEHFFLNPSIEQHVNRATTHCPERRNNVTYLVHDYQSGLNLFSVKIPNLKSSRHVKHSLAGNVSVAAVGILYGMGYKNVYLLGCDARYGTPAKAGSKATGNENCHFIDNYLPAGYVHGGIEKRFSIDPWTNNMKLINSMRNHGFNVYLCTPNSLIEGLPYIEPEELFSEK